MDPATELPPCVQKMGYAPEVWAPCWRWSRTAPARGGLLDPLIALRAQPARVDALTRPFLGVAVSGRRILAAERPKAKRGWLRWRR